MSTHSLNHVPVAANTSGLLLNEQPDSVPQRFAGWGYDTWTRADLLHIGRLLGLNFPRGWQKYQVYEGICTARPTSVSLSVQETAAINLFKWNKRSGGRAGAGGRPR